jgi:multicomponent Na+:H+ antiporter subunit D
MNGLLVLPVLIPLFGFLLQLCFWRSAHWQRWLNIIVMSLYLLAAIFLFTLVLNKGYLVEQMGAWPAPFGITLVADVLSSLMVLLTAIVAFCIAIYSLVDIQLPDLRAGFYPAYNVLTLGLSGAFLTGDIFNLYVWFEVTLISSFVLLVLSGGKFQLEAAVKYAVLNLIATLLLLSAIALLYGVTGSLNLANLSVLVAKSHYRGLLTAIAVLFMMAFGMKAALFPLYFWLPASYHTSTYSTSALFAGLLTKLGVYALIRLFTLVFLIHVAFLHGVLLILAGVTLVFGLLGSIAHYRLRRVFSFSLISHLGFIVAGLALATPLALAGAIYYMVQHVFVKSALFLSAGVVRRFHKMKNKTLYRCHPFFAGLFFVAILSLVGVPPFSGFWPKLMLLEASVNAHQFWLTLLILFVSIFTLYVMIRLWHNCFYIKPEGDVAVDSAGISVLIFPILLLTALILCLGIFPAPFFHLSKIIAWQLLHPQTYVAAVLGGKV